MYMLFILCLLIQNVATQSTDNYTSFPNSTEVKMGYGGERTEPGSPEFWLYIGIALSLTLLAGMASGLTLGYVSIDELVLELKAKNGTELEKKQVFFLLII